MRYPYFISNSLLILLATKKSSLLNEIKISNDEDDDKHKEDVVDWCCIVSICDLILSFLFNFGDVDSELRDDNCGDAVISLVMELLLLLALLAFLVLEGLVLLDVLLLSAVSLSGCLLK